MSLAPVCFAGSLQESEFLRIQRAILPVWARWPVFVPAFLIGVVQVESGWERVWQEPLRALPDLVVGLVGLGVCGLIVRWSRRKAWLNYVRLHGDIAGQVSPEGLEWRTETTVNSLPWSKFIGHRIAGKLALLFYAPRSAFFLPRDFVASEPEWIALQQLIRAHSKAI